MSRVAWATTHDDEGMDLAESEAGEAGLAYIRSRLEGGLSLSSRADEGMGLADGTESSVVGVVHPDPGDFGSGCGSPASPATQVVVGLVRHVLASHPDGALWVEGPNPRRSDPFWRNPDLPKRPAWFHEEEVFTLGFGSDSDERLAMVLDQCWDYPGWGGGGFVTANDATHLIPDFEISNSDLTAAAEHIELVICGAYDGEGYLLWRPSRP